MKKENGFASLRAAVAVGAASALVVWVSAQDAADEGGPVSGPGLRAELRWAQVLAPPAAGEPLAIDGGACSYRPGTLPDDEAFAEGLVPRAGADGADTWPVVLFEDPLSRETVFVNADGEEFGRLAPPPGYDPGWIVGALYPEGLPPEFAAADYDPSRVILSLLLSLPPADATGQEEEDPPPEEDPQAADPAPAGDPEPDREPPGQTVSEQRSQDRAAGQPPGAGAAGEVYRGGRGRTLYADADIGDDACDGASAERQGEGKGPKASVQSALDAAASGDVIELRGFAAFSDRILDPGDKDIVLLPVGPVSF